MRISDNLNIGAFCSYDQSISRCPFPSRLCIFKLPDSSLQCSLEEVYYKNFNARFMNQVHTIKNMPGAVFINFSTLCIRYGEYPCKKWNSVSCPMHRKELLRRHPLQSALIGDYSSATRGIPCYRYFVDYYYFHFPGLGLDRSKK